MKRSTAILALRSSNARTTPSKRYPPAASLVRELHGILYLGHLPARDPHPVR
jgi:hypothetical protein